jgi:DNA-binding SARP family transcriptional activator
VVPPATGRARDPARESVAASPPARTVRPVDIEYSQCVIVHDLGTLVVDNGQQILPMRGKKPTALLALLLINVNRRVPIEAIMDAVWGDQVAARKPATVESHVWRLRQSLEPDRKPRETPTILVNDAAGYRLLLAPDQLDSARFEQLVGSSRDLLDAGQPPAALAALDQAMSLWRGRAYSPLSDERWAAVAATRLDEARSHALELRIDSLLALGRPEEALSAVEPLLGETPYRERVWAQRMLALYQGGRSGEALQTYRRARALLLDDLGLEPGPDLQQLHRRILDRDPTLQRSF